MEEMEAVNYFLYYHTGLELLVNLAIIVVSIISLYKLIKAITKRKIPIYSAIVAVLSLTIIYNSFMPVGSSTLIQNIDSVMNYKKNGEFEEETFVIQKFDYINKRSYVPMYFKDDNTYFWTQAKGIPGTIGHEESVGKKITIRYLSPSNYIINVKVLNRLVP